MMSRRAVFAATAVLLLAALPAAAGCPPRGGMGFLTPEQQLMHFADMQKATAGMSIDAMRDYRLKERQRVFAMSGADRDRYTADLNARWQALSPADQQKIRDQWSNWRANHPRGMGGGWGGRGCPNPPSL